MVETRPATPAGLQTPDEVRTSGPEPAPQQQPATMSIGRERPGLDLAVLPSSADRAALASPPTPARSPAPLLPLLVIGAGGHARVLIDIAEKQGRYRVFGLVDERPDLRGTMLLGYAVLGGSEVLERADLPSHAVVAIGSPDDRAAWQERLEALGMQLALLVHPSAQIGRDVRLGAGSVLMAGAIVNPGSRIGRGVILNTGSSVDHDCEIGDFVHVAPGARLAGGVRVGPRSHIGIGSCVIQNLAIGSGVIVGAGAAVVHPVADGLTVGGVPARPLTRRLAAPTLPPAADSPAMASFGPAPR